MRKNEINRQATEAMKCTSLFYGLEALKVGVGFNPKYSEFLKSNEKLLRDITEYQLEVAEVIAQMLYDYTVVVCYGELRHMGNNTGKRYLGCGFDLKTVEKKDYMGNTVVRNGEVVTEKEIMNRSESYDVAIKYNPQQILELSAKSFSGENGWNGGYGGEKWKQIAEHGLKYGKMDLLLFCDTAFSLSHNSSPYLDKSSSQIFYINSTEQYKELLDVKFAQSPTEIIEHILLATCGEIDYKMKKLIQRAVALGFIDLGYNASYRLKHGRAKEILKEISLSYAPLPFKNRVMKPRKINACCNTIKESKFFDLLEEHKHVMLIDETKKIAVEDLTTYNVERDTIEYFIKNKKIQNNFSNLVITHINRRGGTVCVKDMSTNKEFTTGFRNLKVLDDDMKIKKIA